MTRVRLGPVKNSSGKLCVDSEEIGEALNEYFSSVFTQERDSVVEGSTSLLDWTGLRFIRRRC